MLGAAAPPPPARRATAGTPPARHHQRCHHTRLLQKSHRQSCSHLKQHDALSPVAVRQCPIPQVNLDSNQERNSRGIQHLLKIHY
uniref:Uncharacterized protein n=1 Tax=Oryza meridionalis TaxID=40149 RepID=A0A0E0CNA3_9ORYZ